MHLSNLVLAAASVGSVAARSVHQRHADFHEKRAYGDLVTATIFGTVVTMTDTWDGAATAAAAPAAAAAASPAESESSSTASASDASTSILSSFKKFCSRSTAEEIAATGNDAPCGVYDSNIMLVAEDLESSYQYTIKVINNLGAEASCGCGNKAGADGGTNGFFGTPKYTFSLADGANQVVAIDGGSIGFCSCAQGSSLPQDEWGQVMGTELEFEVESVGNGGWNGIDLSIIAAQVNSGAFIPGSACVAGSGCSTINADGSVVNAYNAANQHIDGIGMNVAPTDNLSITYTLG